MSENTNSSEETLETNQDNQIENPTVDKTTEEQLEALQAANKELEDKYLRLYAEFDNFRRRSARESIEMRQQAGKEIISSLLDVLDDSERAEKQIRNAGNTDSVMDGALLVFGKLRNILLQKGLKPMESIQEEFDVEKHEAITQIEVSDEMKGKVIDEVMKGYYLNDKIIRFAKVVVGK